MDIYMKIWKMRFDFDKYNFSIDGSNDNTILLLFNMIGEIKNKKSESEFYPLN